MTYHYLTAPRGLHVAPDNLPERDGLALAAWTSLADSMPADAGRQ